MIAIVDLILYTLYNIYILYNIHDISAENNEQILS